ncbi:hypothetical protein HG536_0C01000 [Torulaspora globosa]|uniref:Uncharacterized protein n=1 Tax=Torulaspora globosa TaxID=48254 RepID=A0A7G3ZEJ7_9SACH|nr:uncharacterized protein HG536_0C01000 [Torulaspora globosa]QLL31933.1 hypothetical protein HG536_0C01000 [Torulaspora globosa]
MFYLPNQWMITNRSDSPRTATRKTLLRNKMDPSAKLSEVDSNTQVSNGVSENGNLTRSDISSLSDQKEQSIADLINESQRLQKDINSIFAELSDINRQVRIDIDDFCRIGLHNTSAILNSSSSE